MKKSIFYFILLLSPFFLNASSFFQSVPRQARQAVAAIEKLPEARELLQKVRQEGPVRILMERQHDRNIEAVWDPNRRAILINPEARPSLGCLICSILFELHNAQTNHKLNRLSNQAHVGQLTKDQYVESVERVEYNNAKQAAALLKKGVAKGIFPRDAQWYVFNTFEDHYKIQQIFGHSYWIARQYDMGRGQRQTMPYRGTIRGLQKMSQKDRNEMLRFLSIKNSIESSNPVEQSQGTEMLKMEWTHLKKSNQQQQSQLLEIVFNGHPTYEALNAGVAESVPA